MGRLIVEKAVVPRRPDESAQKLARLARVSRKFREFSQDIQESHPDIKRAGVRGRQDLMRKKLA